MTKIHIKFSLRNKFLIPTVLLVILGMAISTTVSYFNAKEALDRAIKEQITKITESTADRLGTWAERTSTDLSNWSKIALYKSSLKDDFMGKAARKASGKELSLLAKGYQFYEGIYLADANGEVIAASNPEAVEKIRVSGESYFNESLAGEVSISDVFRSPLTGDPVVAIASPMREEQTIAGVLIGIVDVGYLNKTIIDPVKFGEGGYAYLFDRTGLIIAHPDKSNILQLNMNDYDFGRTMLENKEGILIYTFDNIEKIVSYETDPVTGWCVGVGVGTSEVFSPIKRMGFTNLAITFVVILLLVLTMWLISGILIIKPISKVVQGLKDIAQGEGDLTTRLESDRGDEVGELSKWFNKFMEQLQSMIKEIRINSDTMNSSSLQLSDLSSKMSEGADSMSSRSNNVASAAEEMTTSLNSVAASMEQASTNINLVATSAEEMTATISEIAQNSDRAKSITDEAVSQAGDASKKIDELGQAAKEIGQVTETITEISEQTNLLALNATIEAARAGEAGKGFTVVANEIKELARQTAEATQDIKNRINSIQNSTSESVTQVEGISNVIHEVNEIVSSIAVAVGEQSETTREIAGNVSQASLGVQEVSQNMSQSSTVAGDIAEEISSVNQSATDISNGSSQVDMSAQELSRLAAQLKEMVEKFKVD